MGGDRLCGMRVGDVERERPHGGIVHSPNHEDAWWYAWADWIGERAGWRREPPLIGSRTHPPLGDAPGEYVHER